MYNLIVILITYQVQHYVRGIYCVLRIHIQIILPVFYIEHWQRESWQRFEFYKAV